MILVTCGREVVTAHPSLASFVLTPSAKDWPPNYRLFIALTAGPAAKTTGLCVHVDQNGQQRIVAEVVYPPFAYALTFNGTDAYKAGEITHWAAAEYGAVELEQMDLALGFCYTAYPGGLRTAAQIERTRP